MDIRIVNTKSRIINGLIELLSTEKLDQCSVREIVEKSGVSKKTFYNLYKNKQDFISQLENDILGEVEDALEQDRKSLEGIEKRSIEEIAGYASFAFDHILNYCDENSELISALLSSNGDITFSRQVVHIARNEFGVRVPMLVGEIDNNISESDYFKIFTTIYVDNIIDVLRYWLNHKDTLSLENVKELLGTVQVKSPAMAMLDLVKEN